MKTKPLIFLFLLLSLVTSFVSISFAEEPPPVDTVREEIEPFQLGFLPTNRLSSVRPRAVKVTQFLSQEMGIPVEAVFTESYEELFDLLKSGELDASFMMPTAAWLAHKKADARVILAETHVNKPVRDIYLFGYQNNSLKNLEDLYKKRFAFTSWDDLGSFVLLFGKLVEDDLIYLEDESFESIKAGVDDFFAFTIMIGNHGQCLQLLNDHQVDLVTSEKQKVDAYFEEKQNNTKIIKQIGAIPTPSIVVRYRLKHELQKNFSEAFQKLTQPENQELLHAIYDFGSFSPTTTTEQLTDFGTILDLIPGLHSLLLEDRSYNKQLDIYKVKQKMESVK